MRTPSAKTPSTKKPPSSAEDNVSANIKVVVRVRPPNDREKGINSRNIIEIVDDKMLEFDPKESAEPFYYQGKQHTNRNFLKRQNKEMKFMFDNVFGPMHTNENVFCATTKNTIMTLMEGFNCSVFVYGATGAGKTYTMVGSKSSPGITYLTMDYLFSVLESFENEREFDICVSYLEVYNENVFDLLNTHKIPLQLREDAKFGVIVAGLTINQIKTAKELIDMLEKGNRNRTQHPTDANAESSRSHAVFQVYVKMRYKTTGSIRMVKLSMIDLAGSERAAATGCSGDRFKEGANINRSLLSLANCINKLADGCKYIPYRDSKLTRLLKDSLGGNCHTVMIANVSPSSLTYEDTYNTLKYASRAKNIQVSVKKNVADCTTHVAEYVKIIEELRKQIRTLSLQQANQLKHVAVKKEPEGNVSEWRKKLQTEFTTLSRLDRTVLGLISKQKVWLLRLAIKQKSQELLSFLCEHENDDFHEVCTKDINRQTQAMKHFNQQISLLQKKLYTISNERNESHNRFVSLCLQAKLECPSLADFIEKLKLTCELNLIQARDEHKSKVLEIQKMETSSCAAIVEDVPMMLKKLFLILKGYGKVTPQLTEEYLEIMRKVKSTRGVSFEGDEEQFEDMQFRSIIDLNYKIEDRTPKLKVKTEAFNTPIVLDSDSDVEHKVMLKRRGTPKGRPMIILDVSSELEEMSPPKKLCEGLKNINFNCENSFKSIDPNDLNSTFVLAKEKKESAEKCEERPVLKDKANFRMPDPGTVTKSTAGKPVIARPVPPRKLPFSQPTPANQIQRKIGFGSTTARGPIGQVKPRDVQVGCKAVRVRERPGTSSHPYVRPTMTRVTNMQRR